MNKPKLPQIGFDLNRLFFLFLRCALSLVMGSVTFLEIVKAFVPGAYSSELILFVIVYDIVIGVLFILSDYFILALIGPAIITMGMVLINIMGFVSAGKEIYYGLQYGNLVYQSGDIDPAPYSGDYTSWLGFAALFSIICFYVVMVSYLGSRPLLGTMPFWFLIVSSCLIGEFPSLAVILVVVCSTALNMILNNYGGKGLNLSALFSGSAITAICALVAILIFLPPAARFAHEHSDELRALQQSIFESKSLDPLKDDLSTAKLENTPITHTGEEELSIEASDAPSSTVYLKALSAAQYTGSGWKAASGKNLLKYVSQESDAFNTGFNLLDLNSSAEGVSQLKYTITHEEDTSGYAYVPENSNITSEDNTKSDAYITREQNSYSFIAYQPVDKFSLTNTLTENNLVNWANDTYTDTAGFEKDSRFTALLDDALGLSYNEKIEYVKNLLASDYSYSNDLTAIDSGTDYVENFLFTQKKGYCQHFASAATLMYRYLGIPARYCVGYMLQSDDFSYVNDNYFTVVKDYSAHAWVEVFSEELGWVSVDVTPSNFREAYFGMNAEDNSETENEDNATPTPSPTPTPTPEPEDDTINPEDEANATPTPSPIPPQSTYNNDNDNTPKSMPKIIIVLLIIVLLAAAYFTAKKTCDSKRFKVSRSRPITVVLAYLSGLIELCCGKRLNETDREYLTRVLAGKLSAEEISKLSDYFEKAAFSGGKFSDTHACLALCKKTREALLSELKPFKKFITVYVLFK